MLSISNEIYSYLLFPNIIQFAYVEVDKPKVYIYNSHQLENYSNKDLSYMGYFHIADYVLY